MALVIAGTGSRSFVLTPKIYAQMVRIISAQREKDPDMKLMSGMAEGWDEYIARLANRAGIPWIAAIPNKGYGAYYWGRTSLTGRDRLAEFNALRDTAESVVYVCESIYVKVDGRRIHANFVRNQYMVDHADAFYVFNPTSSGTRDCLARIKQAGKQYKVIV